MVTETSPMQTQALLINFVTEIQKVIAQPMEGSMNGTRPWPLIANVTTRNTNPPVSPATPIKVSAPLAGMFHQNTISTN